MLVAIESGAICDQEPGLVPYPGLCKAPGILLQNECFNLGLLPRYHRTTHRSKGYSDRASLHFR